MPTWPTFILPSDISPVRVTDSTIVQNLDAVLFQARPRWEAPKQRYIVSYYGLTTHQKNVFERFIHTDIRGSLLPFEWTHPQYFTIEGASNTDPILITTTFNHGLRTYDQVVITEVGGNTAANSTHAAIVVTSNTFQLYGVAGNGAYTSGGKLYLFFPKMRLALDQSTYEGTEKVLGPDTDNFGIWTMSFRFEETF